MQAFDIKKTVKGILLAMVFSIILTGILSVAVYFSEMSDSMVSAFILIISVFSVAAAAFILTKNIPQKGLLNGLLLAIGYILLITLISIALNGSVSTSPDVWIRCVGILSSGMLGGVLGINNKQE